MPSNTIGMSQNIDLEDLIKLIKIKLVLETSSNSYKIRNYTFKGKHILVNPYNSILFEFPTPQNDFPDLYDFPFYSLIFYLGINEERQFKPTLINEIKKIQNKDNIDKIVIWITNEVDPNTSQLLKDNNIDTFYITLPDNKNLYEKPISNFIPLKNDIQYSVFVNTIVDRLIKRLRKLFHLILSEIAAPLYDEHYSKDKIATKAIMDFEETRLQKLLKRMDHNNRNLAIDVGCGTGRHSFIISKKFSEVYAFDFSPRMIKVALEKKKNLNDTKIIFFVNDFEYDKIVDEDKFYGKADLVVASFGMGSFVEDTVRMLRRFYEWLKPGGFVFISFYNENSIILNLTPNWRDTSLSSAINPKEKTLKVQLPGGTQFDIFCKPFSKGTKGEINKVFIIDEIYTYPTIMALLPNSLLKDKFAFNIFNKIDESFSKESENIYGHYVIVVAHKPIIPIKGYSNIIKILSQLGVKYEEINHPPVLSIEDVIKAMSHNIDKSQMIKTIIFKDKTNNDFISVSIIATKMVNKETIANILNISKNKIKFASEKEILNIGFPLGGIAPFGFEKGYKIHNFIDKDIKELHYEWYYMGIGDNRKTLKIKKSDFTDIVKDYIWIDI